MAEWSQRKARVLTRLRRAEGQVRGVIRMVEAEDDCERVAQQLAAVRKALDRAFYDMMACATQRELEAAGAADAKVVRRLDHMSELLARYG
jgi:CsoR family transcriptional regulator, copper-sensing transcriptional repressor